MIRKLNFWMLLALMAIGLASCSEDSDNNSSSKTEGTIVGSWFSDVSGKTYAKWNYGKT